MTIPTGISPQFTIHPHNWPAISESLTEVGHVVLNDIFPAEQLLAYYSYSKNLFRFISNNFYKNKKLTTSDIMTYFGGTSNFYYLNNPHGKKHAHNFMQMLAESGLPDLFHFIFGCETSSIHGPCLRQVNPCLPQKHIGLHADLQINNYLKSLGKSQTAYTVWIPFSNIDSATPGLLLLNQRFRLNTETISPETLEPQDRTLILDKEQRIEPIDITDLYISSQPRSLIDQDQLYKLEEAFQLQLQSLCSKLNNLIYSPHLTAGSVIIFHNDIIHGSYCTPSHSNTRLSADLRFIESIDSETLDLKNEHIYSFRRNAYKICAPEDRAPIHRKIARKLIKEPLYKIKGLT